MALKTLKTPDGPRAVQEVTVAGLSYPSDVVGVAPAVTIVGADGTQSGPQAAAVDSTGAAKAANLTFLGHQLGLAVDTSTALTVPAGTRYAQIQARAQAVRYRYDGATTAPTAASGMRLAAGAEVEVDVTRTDLVASRWISETAGALLDIAYFS